MAPAPSTPRRTARGRPRGRPKGSGSASASRSKRSIQDGPATEPPPKRRRYIPGGPGGGGRFIDDDGNEVAASSLGPSTTSRPRAASNRRAQASPSAPPRRERSTRVRATLNRDDADDMPYSTAAAVAAAVVQSEGYKPREERGWEEFHPNLDIEATFMVFNADEVDGVVKTAPPTPAVQAGSSTMLPDGAATPTKETNPGLANGASETPSGQGKPAIPGAPGSVAADTPSRRRIGRPARESFSLYATRSLDLGPPAPKVPKVLPITGQSSKERLDLKQPQYRRTNRVALFESKTFGQARYVDKSMMNVGYQESDQFIRPERDLIKASDTNMDEELEMMGGAARLDGEIPPHPAGAVGRVEYDMDEQDDMWLEKLNAQRKAADLEPITREIFEITITKIEKEWHALEKRIPKPNPKPPQTHRPRSSSAAAVNGEPLPGEEQDSKCAICDDGDCENTNAIVFCDGCDLAVHQECYGVPFIPEGQWLCRKCQLIGRGIPTCIFCPNTDGAFKQTNSSKWAHLLCAMWIPEVSLGNHTFMEPVMEVEKVPKTRWRLTCYICQQRMGACIQCSNKNCYQAFHVTCARRCRLFLRMKTSQGLLAVLDGNIPLKAFCDKHCPPDYAEENKVAEATKEAKKFYKRTMKNRIWADSQASALQLAATHRNAITEHPPDESQLTGAKLAGDKKKGQPPKNVWKLPSGAPIIPQAVYDLVESALARFTIRKRKDFVSEACKYWTLKREARRGAALLKRLQLQMETFTSMELTRRNFAAMGPSGKARLERRIEFCRGLVDELRQLKELCEQVEQREAVKLEMAELEADFVDTCYFPIYKEIRPVLERAISLDKNVFRKGFESLLNRMDRRYYVQVLPFVQDLCKVINEGINNPPTRTGQETKTESVDASPSKSNNYNDAPGRRRLGKRILKLVQPQIEAALKAEAEICRKPYEPLQKELEAMLEASVEIRQAPAAGSITVVSEGEQNAASSAQERRDVDMTDAPAEGQIIVADQSVGEEDAEGEPDDTAMGGGNPNEENNIEVSYFDQPTPKPDGVFSADSADQRKEATPNPSDSSAKPSNSPPSLPGGTYPQPSASDDNHLQAQADPLTPPRSNTGSITATTNPVPTIPVITTTSEDDVAAPDREKDVSGDDAPADFLTAGGIPWYLTAFDPYGTTAVEVSDEEEEDKEEEEEPDQQKLQEPNGRAALRSFSEELTDLTDMDDEALRDLENDVDEEMTITIPGDGYSSGTASRQQQGKDDAEADVEGEEEEEEGGGKENPAKPSSSKQQQQQPKRERRAAARNAASAAASPAATNGVANTSTTGRKMQVVVNSGSGGGSPRKRTRSEVAAAAAAGQRSLRSGARSSSGRKK